MYKTVLKTDFSAYTVSRGHSDYPASFIIASYWDNCPVTRGRFTGCLPFFSKPLSTYILSAPSVRPWEQGVYYRLPPSACDASGFDEPLSLIPLRIKIEHAPCIAIHVDEYGRTVSLCGKGSERVYSTLLAYGSHTLCGLFPTETAKRWAALPCNKWSSPFVRAVERQYGVDASWLRPLSIGAATISYDKPLFERAVEVYRETV